MHSYTLCIFTHLKDGPELVGALRDDEIVVSFERITLDIATLAHIRVGLVLRLGIASLAQSTHRSQISLFPFSAETLVAGADGVTVSTFSTVFCDCSFSSASSSSSSVTSGAAVVVVVVVALVVVVAGLLFWFFCFPRCAAVFGVYPVLLLLLLTQLLLLGFLRRLLLAELLSALLMAFADRVPGTHQCLIQIPDLLEALQHGDQCGFTLDLDYCIVGRGLRLFGHRCFRMWARLEAHGIVVHLIVGGIRRSVEKYIRFVYVVVIISSNTHDPDLVGLSISHLLGAKDA